MAIRFYIDAETHLPHIYNHGVDEHEVEEVMMNVGEDRPGKDGSRVAMGQTDSGRYLKVVYVEDKRDGSLFVVTAFDLTGKPLTVYRRRRKKDR